MFSDKLYEGINLETQFDKDEFDNIFFKSIGLYQAAVRYLTKEDGDIYIFRNKKLIQDIQDSLSKIYPCTESWFDLLYMELNEILKTRHLKLGEIGILKKDVSDIVIVTS